MVEDPLLAHHLAHFVINRMMLTKTDKTMEELEVDANLKFQFDAIQVRETNLDDRPVDGSVHCIPAVQDNLVSSLPSYPSWKDRLTC